MEGRKLMIFRLLCLSPAALALGLSIAQTRAGTLGWNNDLTLLVAQVSIAIWLGALLANGPAFPRKLAPAFVLICVGTILGCGVIDDAYISLRYARNLSAGYGLVFNVGEKVEGYTGFLWVILLGASKSAIAGIDLPSLARVLGVGFALIGIWAADRTAAKLARHDTPPARGIPASSVGLLLAVHFPLVFWSFSGMETGLYLALLSSSAYFFCDYLLRLETGTKQIWASASLLTLALLTRPETYLLCFGYVPFIIAREQRVWSAPMAIFTSTLIALFVPYVSWRHAYYGYLLPNTYYAKVGTPFAHWEDGMDYVLSGFVAHGMLLPFVFRGLRGTRPSRLPRRFLLSLVLLIAASVIVTGGDTFSEWRYFVYMLPFLYVLGRDELARTLSGLIPPHSLGKMQWFLGSQMLALASVSFFLTTFLFGAVGPQTTLLWGAREAAHWAVVGRWFAEHTRQDEVLATPVIGAIGYYSDRTVIDMLGLTDKVIARTPVRNQSGPKGHLRSNPKYVLARRPTYIYLLSEKREERAFLGTRHWIPAIDDLRRFFPNPDYRYEVQAWAKATDAFYVRRDRTPLARLPAPVK